MSKLCYKGPAKIKANQLFRCTLTVILEETISAGGLICIASRHVSDIGLAQHKNPDDDNYVDFSSSNAFVRLELVIDPGWDRHPWNRGFSLAVTEGALQKGDMVTIEMGGNRGFRAQSFSETSSGFRLGIKRYADDAWTVSPAEPLFEVTGAEAVRIKAYVKDINNEDDKKLLCVKTEDAYSNIALAEQINLDMLLDDTAYLGSLTVTEGTAAAAIAVPRDNQWHRITLSSPDGKFFARTNPFGPPLVENLKLYFGDIHAQSGLCDGTNSPEYLYSYAKTAAGLDFASVTSHDMELDAADWEAIQKATKQANQPNEFVTFLGYEWSGGSEAGGDHNIYFKSDSGPLIRNTVYPSQWCVPHVQVKDCNLTETISRLKQASGEFMVIPHCGGRIANFDYYDPSVMHVFEIHSTHKNYENVWRNAVERGLQLGLIGGSDDHRGMIGDCALTARDWFFSGHCGLICVYAKSLTREALWDAIQKRHTYATNGPHIALSFTLGQAIMGDEVKLNTGSLLQFSFKVVCDRYFDKAELYRNNEIIQTFSELENQIQEYEGSYEAAVEEGHSLYYLKILQIDGGTAWSSPIFVNGTQRS